MEIEIGDMVTISGLHGDYEVLGIEGERIYYSPSNCGVIDKRFYALICYINK